MNRAVVDPIANAVLYEGYILYPYRPSTKNRQRWTFGGLYPESYSRAQCGEAWSQQTECLIEGTPQTMVEALVRFLHLTDRQVGAVEATTTDHAVEPPSRPVESLRIDGKLFQSWQEAEEREVVLGGTTLSALGSQARETSFTLSGRRTWEPLLEPDGRVAGVLVRRQQAITGIVEMSAARVAEGLFRLTVQVANRTPVGDAGRLRRDEAQLRSMVSTHVILEVKEGTFVSLMDPPERWRAAAAECRNVGAWPVLVGEEGQTDLLLSAPIILYDYPKVAPESPGDFFDGTEIDEMLTLRIMTLTDKEKEEMAAVDGRASALLRRTEALAREQMLGLHGTLRDVQPVAEEGGR